MQIPKKASWHSLPDCRKWYDKAGSYVKELHTEIEIHGTRDTFNAMNSALKERAEE